MCDHGADRVDVVVRIPADLSCDGIARSRPKKIDRCIAPLVEALETAGIHMRGSCCGHGKGEGDIMLQDGRTLLILQPEDAAMYQAWVTWDKNVVGLLRAAHASGAEARGEGE